MTRVLHVLHNSLPLQCGYSIRSGAIVEHQRRQQLDPVVLTSPRQPGSLEDRVDHVGGTLHFRTAQPSDVPLPLLRERALMRRLQQRIERVIAESRPHVVHAHSPVLVGLPALRAARNHGLPFVYEVRDLWENASVDRGKFGYNSPLYWLARGLETFVLRKADAVVTICEALKADVTSRAVEPKRVFVVGNGVDTAAFAPADEDEPNSLRARYGLAGKRVIAYVGTFQPYEGLELLVNAMPEILARVPSAHLLIVGGSVGENTAIESSLQSSVERLALDRHVTLTGRLPHAMVTNAYALADVVVYPRLLTRTTALTTPLKPLEAMAMGKAVVVSDVPAMKELVADGETGATFPAGNAAALARVCVDLLQRPGLREALGQRARVWTVRHREWPTLVARYHDIYRPLVELTTFPEHAAGGEVVAAAQ